MSHGRNMHNWVPIEGNELHLPVLLMHSCQILASNSTIRPLYISSVFVYGRACLTPNIESWSVHLRTPLHAQYSAPISQCPFAGAEYAFYWSFYQDGSMKYEIKLTGELSTNLLSAGEGDMPRNGTLVADRVNSQYHQHMFCARIDMAVDDEEGGKGLQVSEVRV